MRCECVQGCVSSASLGTILHESLTKALTHCLCSGLSSPECLYGMQS